MLGVISRYTTWLHGQWPAGIPEKMPLINADGTTNLPGTYIVGDLTGVPLLKFSSDTGAKAVKDMLSDDTFVQRQQQEDVYDVVIIGGGVSGYAAAIEAKENNLKALIVEASEPFSTIANFPKNKPIYTYPTDMTPSGALKFDTDVSVKESLYSHLIEKVKDADIQPKIAKASKIKKVAGLLNVELEGESALKAHRVVVAIGRSGNFRKLDVPGFELDKVVNRLHDPKAYENQDVLVIGGGDSALESAIATAEAGAQVTLAYRNAEFNRPKADNIDKVKALEDAGKLSVSMQTQVSEITPSEVELTQNGEKKRIANNIVLSMLGREAPLDFFRRSGISITGESTPMGWLWFALFIVFCIGLYDWKNFGFIENLWGQSQFPYQMNSWVSGWGDWWNSQVNNRTSFVGVLAVSMKSRSFYYTLLYTSAIGYFGWRRIKRRKTPYVKKQTLTLFLVQLFPLFLLPEIFLPWLGYLGAYDVGIGKVVADHLFPSYVSAADLAAHNWPDWGHPRAYWHAYGFILAWPLSVWNVFSSHPMTGGPLYTWIVISVIQTFVIIPFIVIKWGKGAYCGWLCSCGALAETMGDTQRHKMPRGPKWNKLNMLGQAILAVAFVMLFIRIGAWIAPDSWMNTKFALFLEGKNSSGSTVNPLSWKWIVDILLGGILGVGLYFKFSGRTWCRFACPLASLMHIYARFSRFRIFADKNKCISCNACTSVCHQGIDVMSFANKGKPMQDPQCVRCSACVSTCPTGVLNFGEVNRQTGEVIRIDKTAASRVQMAETIEIREVS
ncbi:NAD(P)-binding domain-containing protein [Alteromonas sp. 5E99-2]|uniref:NAD(P)-binding domain-containing protein n=1 Tax=Alteromonas sp. 5E99-2 TaxID=2817683 RepID=UPI001A9969E3|nr:NAD(P)-binding domain-containing protein [Alteromonas sp. 5E99-2]MBO1256580.1 NAD(P)-binding domain-containing protein [Alteromonas sp. 5E99-2]